VLLLLPIAVAVFFRVLIVLFSEPLELRIPPTVLFWAVSLFLGGLFARYVVSEFSPAARFRLLFPDSLHLGGKTRIVWFVDEGTWTGRKDLTLLEMLALLEPQPYAAELTNDIRQSRAEVTWTGASVAVTPPRSIEGIGHRRVVSHGMAVCAHCGTRVLPTSSGACPACTKGIA
jgi:hypothetical protein